MRIGHVAFTYRPIIGGAEVYIDELLRALAADGHDQRVYQCDPGPEERARDPRLVVVPRPRRWPLHRFNLAIARRALALRREQRLVVHDTFHALPVLWHPGLVALSHGVTWDHPLDRRSNRRRRRLAVLAAARARTVVANDTAFYRSLGVDLGPGERFFEEIAPRRFLIPNAVDPERFAPGPGRPDLAGAEVVLVPRNVVLGRGIHLAIAAFRALAASRPAALLLVAGGFHEPDYARRLFADLRDFGLSGRVLFLGPVPHGDMLALYRSAALTVIPSLCMEGTSLAALESMSAGTPVVATRVGGLLDLPCRLADPDPAALGRALVAALAEREELARSQRAAVLARFRPEAWRAAWRRAVAA